MVQKTWLMIAIVLLVVGTGVYVFTRPQSTTTPASTTINTHVTENNNTTIPISNSAVDNTTSTTANMNSSVNSNTTIIPPVTQPTVTPKIVVPIENFFSRVTKKPFGIYITPKTSPVQPEKFTGYHTGADAETTASEATTDVPIYSIADGTVVFAGHVNGYGGVMMIQYTINGETVTALFGHLRITSFTVKKGDKATTGQKIAVLGTGYSSETDGERKHLHFGIIKGANINYKGYVQTKGELSAWDDPIAWLHRNGL